MPRADVRSSSSRDLTRELADARSASRGSRRSRPRAKRARSSFIANAVTATTGIALRSPGSARSRASASTPSMPGQLDVHQHEVGPVRAGRARCRPRRSPPRACGSRRARARRARASGCAGCPRRSGPGSWHRPPRSPVRRAPSRPTSSTSSARSRSPFCARWLMRPASRSRSARVISVVRQDDDRDARGLRVRAEPLDDLEPVHVRHPQVEQDDERVLAGGRAGRPPRRWRPATTRVALRREDRLDEVEVERIVVDHDDRAAAVPGPSGAVAARAGRSARRRGRRKREAEHAALADDALASTSGRRAARRSASTA